jgi:hypothetical protein
MEKVQYNDDSRRLLALRASSSLFHSAFSLTYGDRLSERSALRCFCRAHLHVQGATLALLRDPSRLLGLLNANDVLHVGLHVYHAKRRADIAWPHGRGLAACFRTMGETHVT